jgi:polyisoprenoid-binding protein YceI
MAKLGPGDGSIKVYTKREGMAARMAHDLTLQAGRWDADVDLDGDDISKGSVTATVDAGSLDIVSSSGGATPLSDKDKADIRKNITQKVLPSGQITFRSTAIEPAGDSRVRVSGDLTIGGSTQPVTLDLTRQSGADGEHVSGRITITQSQWGIKPFSAMMGALKVADPVDIELDLRVPKS